jgi:methylamine dehydrogenase accessory protein MauD
MSGVWLASYWVLWLLVLGLVCIVVVLARQIGVLHMRLGPTGARTINAGPAIGALAPEINALDIDGRAVRFGGVHNKRTLLLFIAPKCPACSEVAPSVKAMARSERATLDVFFVSVVDDRLKLREFISKYDLQKIPCVLSEQAKVDYGVAAAPYAVLINERGVVVSKGITNHIEHLESLLNAAELGHATMESLMSQAPTTNQ